MPGVQFDEDQNFDAIPEPQLRPPSLGSDIVRLGIVSGPGDAAIILGIAAMLLIAASFYIIASSVPPPPKLGPDVPRGGETIPQYVPLP